MMALRRAILASILGGKDLLPTGMCVNEFTATQSGDCTVSHSLGYVPDWIAVIAKDEPTTEGTNEPINFLGLKYPSGVENYPYYLATIYYYNNAVRFANASFGWNADNQNVYLHFAAAARFPAQDYILVTYHYPD